MESHLIRLLQQCIKNLKQKLRDIMMKIINILVIGQDGIIKKLGVTIILKKLFFHLSKEIGRKK